MTTYPASVAILLAVSSGSAIALVFLLLGGVLVLTLAPFEIGTIRLAGVSLLWWYGVLAVPLVAVVLAVTALLRDGRAKRDDPHVMPE
jgi:hypothetical protein